MTMRLILLVLLAVFPGLSTAVDLENTTITWVPPTDRVDGTPLSATDLDYYVFSCRTGDGEHVDLIEIPGDRSEYVTPRAVLFPVSGDYWCALRVVDSGGRPSGLSDEVEVNYRAAPGVPGGLQIELDLLFETRVSGTISLR